MISRRDFSTPTTDSQVDPSISRARAPAPHDLPLQQIHRRRNIVHPEILSQRRTHGRVEASPHARTSHVEQHFVAMLRSESLHPLNAPPVPVHVAEPARIHKNVEAKLLSRAESAQHLVVPAAMPQSQVNNLP